MEREKEKVTLELTCSSCYKKQNLCTCESPVMIEESPWWPKGYSLTDKLGENPRSVLYKAKLGTSDRNFAIKIMKAACGDNRDFQRKVRQEVKALTQLTHPNIGATYDGGLTDDGKPFIVRDHVEGVPLSVVLDREGALELQEFYEVFEQVCEALEAARESSVSHFGLSPDNIVMIPAPGGSRIAHHVKVVDFACASLAFGEQQGVSVAGDPRYLSPEQIQGAPKEISSDVYALGCVMYEALSGRPPFSNAPAESLKKSHINETPEPIAKVCKAKIKPALAELVSRCLSKFPHNRFQSFSEILEELKRAESSPDESPVAPNTNLSEGRLGTKATVESTMATNAPRTGEFKKGESVSGDQAKVDPAKGQAAPGRSADRARSADYPKPSFLPNLTPKTAAIASVALLVIGFAAVMFITTSKPAVAPVPAWIVLAEQAADQQKMGNLSNAESYLLNALSTAEDNKAPAKDVANVLAKLGSLYYLQNRPRDAAPYLMRALTMYEEIQGPAGPDVSWIATDIAEIAVATNNWTLAIEMYHKLLSADPKDGNDASQKARARHLGGLGSAYIHEHNYKQALKTLNECFSIQKKLKGGLTSGVSKTALSIAYAHDKLGQLGEAEKFYKQSVDILLAIKPLEKEPLAKAYDYYGNFLKRMKKAKQGDAALNEARKLRGLPALGDEAAANSSSSSASASAGDSGTVASSSPPPAGFSAGGSSFSAKARAAEARAQDAFNRLKEMRERLKRP